MKRGGNAWPAVAAMLALASVTGCARATAARPATGPAQAPTSGQDSATRSAAGPASPRPYARVITSAAETKSGLFDVHRIGERLYFEIPQAELGREVLVVQRTAAGGNTSGFFGGGPTRVVTFAREGNRVLLRQHSFGITADTAAAIALAVQALNYGPIIASFMSKRGALTVQLSSTCLACSRRT